VTLPNAPPHRYVRVIASPPVTIQLLIDAIFRQTTVLIAQLATTGRARTSLSDVAEQIFHNLSMELSNQGVSQKVAADMFGMALRTYRRRVQRLSESRTVAGRSLWEALYNFIAERRIVTQVEVLDRFRRDDQDMLRGLLQDLVDGGLVFRAGRGSNATYRAASPADLAYASNDGEATDAVDALLLAIIFRKGSMDRETLASSVSLRPSDLAESIDRLLASSRLVEESEGVRSMLRVPSLIATAEAPIGWEAAVIDHFQAVVATICQKLEARSSEPASRDQVGGSTYTLEVWPGHPLEDEARGQLRRFREVLSGLRRRIEEHNRNTSPPATGTRVVVYGGQHIIEQDE
jgi:hypothetical protein